MTKSVIDSPCFLCGGKSTYVETDAGNRRYYRCENPVCGEYEISRQAMDQLKNDAVRKAEISSKACKAKNNNSFVRVTLDVQTQQITVAVVSHGGI